jgi:UTP:GlnB (protein PII) uridylyltransferase
MIPVKKAVLFGSYAKGTFDEGSDVDLAIFSDYFEQMDRVEGIKFLLMHAMDYHIDLEPIIRCLKGSHFDSTGGTRFETREQVKAAKTGKGTV